MRVTVLAGLFAFIAVAAVSSSSASAQTPDLLVSNDIPTAVLTKTALETIEPPAPVPTRPEPVVHSVEPDETLSTIATQFNTTWNRLYNKNDKITDPNVIAVGDKITIPLPDEQLAERPLPTPPVVAETPAPVVTTPKPTTTAASSAASVSLSRGTSAGNLYSPGYCTWYAKNMRPDLPNNLGNADTWVARAAAQGIPTGSIPRAGAIGQQGMHVVYIQRVNNDGTVFISEMNYLGLYVISTRTVPASYFQYIY